jgi:hypothetical protein
MRPDARRLVGAELALDVEQDVLGITRHMPFTARSLAGDLAESRRAAETSNCAAKVVFYYYRA